MRIALTGATGFVGRHVRAELLRRGLAPVCIGRTRPGADAAFVAHDLADDAAGVFERAQRPDVLIHLAWEGLPNYASPHHVERELPRQQRLLGTLLDDGLAHLLVTGTCFEYGLREGRLGEDDPTEPVTQYGLAKDRLRAWLQQRQAGRPFALSWARLFYNWGEGQAEKSLWASLNAAVARGEPRFAMSGGAQQRDYLPIGEVARLLVELALRRSGAGVVNVCAGTPVTVRALVEGWIASHGWHIRPELGRYPYPTHEPMHFWGDRRRLDAILANPSD
jgi:nucleoside-diphosphate-sugar epimerase